MIWLRLSFSFPFFFFGFVKFKPLPFHKIFWSATEYYDIMYFFNIFWKNVFKKNVQSRNCAALLRHQLSSILQILIRNIMLIIHNLENTYWPLGKKWRGRESISDWRTPLIAIRNWRIQVSLKYDLKIVLNNVSIMQHLRESDLKLLSWNI